MSPKKYYNSLVFYNNVLTKNRNFFFWFSENLICHWCLYLISSTQFFDFRSGSCTDQCISANVFNTNFCYYIILFFLFFYDFRLFSRSNDCYVLWRPCDHAINHSSLDIRTEYEYCIAVEKRQISTRVPRVVSSDARFCGVLDK